MFELRISVTFIKIHFMDLKCHPYWHCVNLLLVFQINHKLLLIVVIKYVVISFLNTMKLFEFIILK